MRGAYLRSELPRVANDSIPPGLDSEPREVLSPPLPPVGVGLGQQMSLGERLWDFSWDDYLPAPMTPDGIVLVRSSYAQASAFISEHYEHIFGQCERFLVSPDTPAKRRYLQTVADFLEFRHDGECVGLAIGNATDWSSYYLRSMGLLPAFRDQKAGGAYLRFMCEVLSGLGVERVEAHTSPDNEFCARGMVRCGFHHSGTVLSERWGALSMFTKYLDPEGCRVFKRQFCAVG